MNDALWADCGCLYSGSKATKYTYTYVQHYCRRFNRLIGDMCERIAGLINERGLTRVHHYYYVLELSERASCKHELPTCEASCSLCSVLRATISLWIRIILRNAYVNFVRTSPRIRRRVCMCENTLHLYRTQESRGIFPLIYSFAACRMDILFIRVAIESKIGALAISQIKCAKSERHWCCYANARQCYVCVCVCNIFHSNVYITCSRTLAIVTANRQVLWTLN